MSKQETIKKSKYFEAYRKAHREELNAYARQYYADFPEKYKKAFDKYRKSKKGKEAIERYEKSEKRRSAKRIYMREYRAKQKKKGKKK